MIMWLAPMKFHSVQDFVALAFKQIGVTDWKQYVIIDPRYNRPAEVPHLRARTTKVNTKLGWKPKVTFEELITMMVKADIKKARDGSQEFIIFFIHDRQEDLYSHSGI